MCGRVIQSSGPLRLAIVEGLDVSDSRLGNVPRRYICVCLEAQLVLIGSLSGSGKAAPDFL
jgi:hypothetical protein